MSLTDSIRSSIEVDKKRLLHYERFAGSSAKGRLNCRWDHRRSRNYYYYKGPDDKKEHIVKNGPNPLVWKLQMKRLAVEMVSVIRKNIKSKQKLLDDLLPDSEPEIIGKIPKAYRPNSVFKPSEKGSRKVHQSENPFKREQLNIQTSFGLYVRTKSEMMIAELLYSLGIEFYYEKALTLRVFRNGEWITKNYYPDFTIVLKDGRTIYWEHKGMMSDVEYVSRNVQKCVDYNMNGIFQSHNYIVTEEGPDNQIDFEGIKKVVMAYLM